MKYKVDLILVLIAIVGVCYYGNAQVPQAFNYQAVINDENGKGIVEKEINIKLDLLQGNIKGPVVYEETFKAITSSKGVINLQIGTGTVLKGSFQQIDWSKSPYFIRFNLDTSGGNNYKELSTTQLLSVPYALYAETSKTVQNLPEVINPLSHQFSLVPTDRYGGIILSGLGEKDQFNYSSFSIYGIYLDQENQELNCYLEGFPQGISIEPIINTSNSNGSFFDICINYNNVPDGEYRGNIVFKNKYGVTKKYPYKQICNTPSDIPSHEITLDQLLTAEKNILSSFNTFKIMNDEMDKAFMLKSTDIKYKEIYDKAYNSSSQIIDSFFSSPWEMNRIINYLKSTDLNHLDNEKVKEIVNKAKRIQAYMYLVMIKWFGDMPLVINTDVDSCPSRTSKAEILTFIINELRETIYTTKSTTKTEPLDGITTEEAKILLREAYLLKGEWENAINLEQDTEIKSIVTKNESNLEDFIKKLANWKLNPSEDITEASLMEEYMNNFYSTNVDGNLYLNILNYGSKYFNIDSYKCLLPIPQDELMRNPCMTQNPGY